MPAAGRDRLHAGGADEPDGPYRNSDTYRLDGGAHYPPKDYEKWGALIREWARHSKERYADHVDSWLWELWNEPDIDYFHGSVEEYNRLFDYTEHAIRSELPDAVVGGPHTASAGNFMREFLRHCLMGTNHVTGERETRLDYIAFHAKGGVDRRDDAVFMNLGNQLVLHRRGFAIVAEFPQYRDTPIIIGEADPDGCAACPSSRFPNHDYRNYPAYGVYEVAMMHYTMALAEREGVNLKGLVTWAWTFPDQPIFSGFRSLATHGIHKPVLNAFKMLGQLTGDRLPVTSDAALGLDRLMSRESRGETDINAMATRDGDIVRVLVWNYNDWLRPAEPADVIVAVKLDGQFGGRARLTHHRVDNSHSNAYAAWVAMGRPGELSEEQRQVLEQAMQLQEYEPARELDVGNGGVEVRFELPRHGLSLLTIEPAG